MAASEGGSETRFGCVRVCAGTRLRRHLQPRVPPKTAPPWTHPPASPTQVPPKHLIPLPATFLVFVESDFTPGWPEDLVRGSPGPALLFHRTELQILSMEDLFSSLELPVQGDPAVLLGAITARSPLPGPSYGSGLTSHPPGHSPRGFN